MVPAVAADAQHPRSPQAVRASCPVGDGAAQETGLLDPTLAGKLSEHADSLTLHIGEQDERSAGFIEARAKLAKLVPLFSDA